MEIACLPDTIQIAEEQMAEQLKNGDKFPDLTIPQVGGGTLHPARDFDGEYRVILIYRGHWCPFCNEQIAAFAHAADALSEAAIRVMAFSVDDEAASAAFAARHDWPFPLGHSADVDTIVARTGAYDMRHPGRGHFLETTGFVLAPDGSIVNAVYSTRAIGRLVPGDVIRLVAFMRSLPS
ncbi:redoxin domain-containing protein [Nguyenibacter sp. L1]|uniref:redoxin domain-containing protein n=1 Tax=Nguyenibacter sp. L1 TaxID=3049350 RepID=UPI002B49C326|nr:redoxin domain-containing protein [Nguyenibacter sp. L1]WRH86560.1 redoxin domain-containing protein [Nguyenibacter sp. L1]